MKTGRASTWGIGVVGVALLALALLSPPASAHPPREPDHGLNETTYCSLWAGDTEAANLTALEQRGEKTSAGTCALAAGTDVPLNAPPRAVEQWNRGDLGEFPRTSASRSVAPSTARLSDGRFVADAYVSIFTVQPSTRARLSSSSGDQPRYIASNGSVLATLDYRVDVPADDSSRNRRVFWRLERHSITETRLLVDGRVESSRRGSHTVSLPYEGVGAPAETRTLTVEGEIAVTLSKRIEVCTRTAEDGACQRWRVTTERVSESQTVRDRVETVVYDLDVSGFRAVYPDGDLGLVVYKNQPWLGYTVPGGEVNGVWRFYVARDPAWDRLTVRTDRGSETRHSPLHPLQVTAYPIEPGPTASPPATVRILDVYGTETDPPTLPGPVSLDARSVPYTASYGIATRTNASARRPSLTGVRAHGLVRGVATDADPASFAAIPIHQSNLSLAVVGSTADTVTVRVRLEDVQTGEPIVTADRGGSVIVEGQRHNTTANGTLTTTLSRPAGSVTARYDPGPWWDEPVGYVGDSDVVYVRGTVIQLLETLYAIAVPVGLFLGAVFIISRITGWDVWPPWRQL